MAHSVKKICNKAMIKDPVTFKIRRTVHSHGNGWSCAHVLKTTWMLDKLVLSQED